MPLLKEGRAVEDSFLHLADDAPVPDGAPVVVSAERLRAEFAQLGSRTAPLGVAWPNDRKIIELAPYLDRLALVALSFPAFKDGRAYSQARVLRAQYGFRGELRATGEVLRDQFSFLVRSGFDALEVKKDSDAAMFAEVHARYSAFYQPSADGGPPVFQRRRAHHPTPPGPAIADRDNVPRLNRVLDGLPPADIIAEAIRTVPKGKLAVVSSFGIEAATLLKFVADVDRSLPVLFLDTGWLFAETLSYRDALVARLGLTDVRTLKPPEPALAAQDPRGDLWFNDSEACCRLRKVLPLAEALQPFDAWINGRKRFHGRERANLPIVEHDGRHLKFNPLVQIAPRELTALYRTFDLPEHPLKAAGFPSVGCLPCTSRTFPGEDIRAGRWRGRDKKECGIHALTATAAESAGS